MKTIKFNALIAMMIWTTLFMIIFLHAASSQSKPCDENKNAQGSYRGFAVIAGIQSFRLHSDAQKINGLPVRIEGAGIGIVRGSGHKLVKAHAALYYSSENFRYSLDVLEAGIQRNIYLLRSPKGTQRFVNPYIAAGMNAQRMTFFGNILPSDHSASPIPAGLEKRVGRVSYLQPSIAMGAQLTADADRTSFFRLFAEVRYSRSVLSHTTNPQLSNTQPNAGMSFTIGATFGHLHVN